MIGWRARLRYWFDNFMARGTVAQILLLALLSLGLVGGGAAVSVGLGLAPVPDGASPDSLLTALWKAFNHAIDTGALGGDDGGRPFLGLMLVVSLGGIFFTSALIGIINNGIEGLIEQLRKGRSVVAERGHTVILGFAPKIHTLLSELAEAKANEPGACVAVLAPRDKVEMDDEIRDQLGRRLKVVTRTGSPLSPADLGIVNVAAAKSIIVLSPETDARGERLGPGEADTVVLKTLLALRKCLDAAGRRPHVVAELQCDKTLRAARLVMGDDAGLVLAPPLISRLLVQTGRQSGLSSVYQELLDFAGCEIYLKEEPALVGRSFREALCEYDTSALMGVLGAQDELLLPPPFDRRFAAGDRLICISEDDDTIVRDGRSGTADDAAIVEAGPSPGRAKERTLLLGASERLGLVLSELDAYVAEGSEAVVVAEDPGALLATRLAGWAGALKHLAVTLQAGDPTDREVLDGLSATSFDHVLVLSETEGRSQDVADARTMTTLIHLRDIEKRAGRHVSITSEILDVHNRELATVAEADDFVVSNTLVSLFLSQLSENPHLLRIFDDLFRPEGYETYLKPASLYVKADAEIDFYTVVEAAARRAEVAIGYRHAAHAADADRSYGVVVNPRKSERLRLGPDDKVIVVAEG